MEKKETAGGGLLQALADRYLFGPTLNVSGYDCAGDQTRCISALLKRRPCIKKLVASRANIDAHGAADIADAVRERWLAGSPLSCLDLQGNPNIGPGGGKSLSDVLGCGLKELNLQNCGLGPDGVSAIANALAAGGSTLVKLNAWGNKCGTAGATALGKALLAGDAAKDLKEIRIDAAAMDPILQEALDSRHPRSKKRGGESSLLGRDEKKKEAIATAQGHARHGEEGEFAAIIDAGSAERKGGSTASSTATISVATIKPALSALQSHSPSKKESPLMRSIRLRSELVKRVRVRFRVDCGYDGTTFAGWQVQPSQPERQTVQGIIELCLARICQQPIRIFGSGRTDAGVHARQQVFHFDADLLVSRRSSLEQQNIPTWISFDRQNRSVPRTLQEDIPPANQLPALEMTEERLHSQHNPLATGIGTGKMCVGEEKNSFPVETPAAGTTIPVPLSCAPILDLCELVRLGLRHRAPSSILCRSVQAVSSDFDARRCRRKRYVYRLRPGFVASPFEGLQCWALRLSRTSDFSVARMREAAQAVVGEHDFTAFAVMEKGDKRPTCRTVLRFDVLPMSSAAATSADGNDDSVLELVVECDFFLYRMVRKLVGALVAVALGKLSVSDIQFLLKGPNPMSRSSNSAVQENGEPLRDWLELSRQVEMAPACGLRMDAVYY